MPLFSIHEFQNLRKRKPLLGLDVGEKTIGIAVSDAGWRVASPYQTLKRTRFKEDVKAILKIMDEYEALGLVVGLPLNLSGDESVRSHAIRQFVQNFLSLKDVPICFWDERLSTAAVTRTMLDAGLTRKKQDKAVDKMAASYILQGALDYFSYHQSLQG
jgi:putative Holliday junction resolvase